MTLYVSPECDAALDKLIAGTAGSNEPWSIEALRREAGPDADLLFPSGTVALIEYWADLADRRMIEASRTDAVPDIKSLTERIKSVILQRLDATAPNRAQVRRALAQLAIPANVATAARMTARTVDAIWRAAGDQSAGLSWYTKRATLAAVYGATLLYWVGAERTQGEMNQFLDRRLSDVAKIGRLRRRFTTRTA